MKRFALQVAVWGLVLSTVHALSPTPARAGVLSVGLVHRLMTYLTDSDARPPLRSAVPVLARGAKTRPPACGPRAPLCSTGADLARMSRRKVLSVAAVPSAIGSQTLGAASILTPTPNTRVILNPAVAAPLRGDWETPALLLLVYEAAWDDALAIMLRAAPPTPVRLLARPKDRHAAQAFAARVSGDVEVWSFSVDSPWLRDFAPLQRRDGVWLDSRYQRGRPNDDALPALLASAAANVLHDFPWTLEGGGLVSNGEGLCAMTWPSFVATRLSLDDSRALKAFSAMLGCRALALVPALLFERTGHVDLVLQFVASGIVTLAQLDATQHPDDAAGLEETRTALSAAARALRQKLQVARVPIVVGDGGTVYSYVNGLRVGQRHLVPSFNAVPAAREAAAHDALAVALSGVAIVPIPADAMISEGGALHCISAGLFDRVR